MDLMLEKGVPHGHSRSMRVSISTRKIKANETKTNSMQCRTIALELTARRLFGAVDDIDRKED